MSEQNKTAVSSNTRGVIGTVILPDGYDLDSERVDTEIGTSKTASDGRTILVPQPADDHNDPLNWSWWKKHLVLITISFISFLPDFGTAMGSVTQIPQAKEWHIPVSTIQESVALNTMLSGVSGIAVGALSNYFGRAPTFFWMRLVTVAGVIWYAKAETFYSFFSARMLVGFFVGAGQTVSTSKLLWILSQCRWLTVTQGGLMWIRDIFFRHELPRKINIWSGFIIASWFRRTTVLQSNSIMAKVLVRPLSWTIHGIFRGVGSGLAMGVLDLRYSELCQLHAVPCIWR